MVKTKTKSTDRLCLEIIRASTLNEARAILESYLASQDIDSRREFADFLVGNVQLLGVKQDTLKEAIYQAESLFTALKSERSKDG